MTKEEKQQYNKEYNRSGRRKLSNRRYYQRNREQLLRAAKELSLIHI